jgi:hypothetical protein
LCRIEEVVEVTLIVPAVSKKEFLAVDDEIGMIDRRFVGPKSILQDVVYEIVDTFLPSLRSGPFVHRITLTISRPIHWH